MRSGVRSSASRTRARGPAGRRGSCRPRRRGRRARPRCAASSISGALRPGASGTSKPHSSEKRRAFSCVHRELRRGARSNSSPSRRRPGRPSGRGSASGRSPAGRPTHAPAPGSRSPAPRPRRPRAGSPPCSRRGSRASPRRSGARGPACPPRLAPAASSSSSHLRSEHGALQLGEAIRVCGDELLVDPAALDQVPQNTGQIGDVAADVQAVEVVGDLRAEERATRPSTGSSSAPSPAREAG